MYPFFFNIVQFVLHRGYLRYFESPSSPTYLKEIQLTNYLVHVVDTHHGGRTSCFTLVPERSEVVTSGSEASGSSGRRRSRSKSKERVFVFQASSDEDCTEWVNKIIKMWTWVKMTE